MAASPAQERKLRRERSFLILFESDTAQKPLIITEAAAKDDTCFYQIFFLGA
jgi:hypothetical protein